jgi:hypothetical protein
MSSDELTSEFCAGYRRGLADARKSVDGLFLDVSTLAAEGAVPDSLRVAAFVADNNLMTCEHGNPDTLEWVPA